MTPIDKIDFVELGKSIKKFREAKNMSQTDLGDKVGLSKATISKYEDGKIKKIDIKLIAAMTRALEVEFDDLVGIDEMSDKDKFISLLNENTNAKLVAQIVGDLSPAAQEEILRYAQYIREANRKGNE